jgi:hypothetical protein
MYRIKHKAQFNFFFLLDGLSMSLFAGEMLILFLVGLATDFVFVSFGFMFLVD